MCDFRVELADLRRRFGARALTLLSEMRDAAAEDEDGLIAFDGETFAVSEAARPFARLVAARFDAYLPRGTGRHSVAV